MSTQPSTAEAYSRCEAITRGRAANFYYGIRLLPRERRRAMCAAYAFARRIDDIGDGELPRADKMRLLERAEAELAGLERSGAHALPAADPVLVALADAHRRFRFPSGALGALIEGVRMDVEEVSYERFEELVRYCRCVAGAIGRVCLAIFGPPEARAGAGEDAWSMADDLGVALQLTNILRDVREDAGRGRSYLPEEDLRRFGLVSAGEQGGSPAGGRRGAPALLAQLTHAAPADAGAAGDRSSAVLLERRPAEGAVARMGEGDAEAALCALVRFEAERAQEWYERGLGLPQLLDRRSAACVLAMSNIYRRLLRRIERDPGRVLRERVSLSSGEKLWVAARSMLGGRA